MNESRYTIGIDLGTSNCAVAYVDTLSSNSSPKILKVAQAVSVDSEADSELTPSFILYDKSTQPSKLSIGLHAKNESLRNPELVIHSSKSWLAHGGINRDDKILPWQSPLIGSDEKLSPLEATTQLLAFLKNGWNKTLGAAHPSYEFSLQQVTVTVPASFDDVAQKLTLEAAAMAGFPADVRLLEEPQAAFYSWLDKNTSEQSLEIALQELFPDVVDRKYRVLVCDIGGGTSDFSIFELSVIDQQAQIKRIRVSNHLLLGGDNIDLAIAHTLEKSLGNSSLDPNSWNSLVAQSRELKERALTESSCETSEMLHVSIAGKGKSLFEQTSSASISKLDLENLILNGFYPACKRDAKPENSQTGLREFGLPYATDVAITRHLAGFISGVEIDAILFNGGSMKPKFLQEHVQDTVAKWQDSKPALLPTESLDLAVALGAAKYGSVIRNSESKITGGYPRTVYVEVQRKKKRQLKELVCILPKGTEEGTVLHIGEPTFNVMVEAPVQFKLHYSNSRDNDKPGDVLSFSELESHELPPLQTLLTLNKGNYRPQDGLLRVKLKVSLTETGILKVSCVQDTDRDTKQVWELEFNLRSSAVETDSSSKVSEEQTLPDNFGQAAEILRSAYGKSQSKNGKSINPKAIPKRLEELFSSTREEWSTNLLRSLWPELVRGMTRRGRSLQHETTWLYLAGYCLRPGYGSSIDTEYMQQLWRCFNLGLSFPKESRSVIQWQIMWRRVAPGLTSEQQETVFKSLRKFLEKKPENSPEALRLACSLERISVENKIQLGKLILKTIKKTKSNNRINLLWELSRLSARSPLHAPLHYVVPASLVFSWLEDALALEWSKSEAPTLRRSIVQASRLTEDRGTRLEDKQLLYLRRKLKNFGADDHELLALKEVVPLNKDDKKLMFGDSIPSGLSI